MKNKQSLFCVAAVEYAEKFKLSIFPCRSRRKEPLTSHGCKDATRDPKQIIEWWSRWPNANVGIACGTPSGGLLVLDIDGDVGQDSIRNLEILNGPLPKTPLSLTGKGQHLFFKTNAQLKNRVRVAPGLDVRTDGGYVIAPPSIHSNGQTYTWEVSNRIDEITIVEAPEWLICLLNQTNSFPNKNRNWGGLVKGSIPCGSRNSTLASVAGHLFRRYVDPNLAEVLLTAMNQYCFEPPLPNMEFDRTVNSIARAECKRRQRVEK
jgi:hypothetical protein